MKKDKITQEQMNEIFEKTSIQERSQIAFIQIFINSFCLHAYENIENGNMDFFKDFTDTLMFRKKLRESEGSKIAFDLLAKSYNYIKEQSEKGKKAMANRWNKQPTENEQFTDQSPF